MEFLFVGMLVPYLINLAAGLTMKSLEESDDPEADERMDQLREHAQAIRDARSLKEQLAAMGDQAARLGRRAGLGPEHEALYALLSDPVFQDELADWLVLWDLDEGEAARRRLAEQMAAALRAEQAEEGVRRAFELIERQVFADPTLAHWRQHLGLRVLHAKVDELRRLAAKQAGEFGAEERAAALAAYRKLALKSCDIIDLAGLPEDDRHLAMKEFVLRQLYIPLRLAAELKAPEEDEEAFARLEERGSTRGAATRVSVGESLGEDRRLMVLGDPGAGKTTLLRWLATGYLLRAAGDEMLAELPDVETLPDEDWLPAVVRCRDLNRECLTGSLDDVLRQTLRRDELDPRHAEVLVAVLREALAAGSALLLIDGLDEIASPTERARFCRQLERVAVAYPKAPMLVTSRIVGYRELGFRMGRGFRHLTVVDLTPEDKDRFADCWAAATEPEERVASAARDLKRAFHSTDRIERLTGNPMLLTTFALVKRKVGKLPSRRADLYREAVEVLLHWRSEVDEPLDKQEALPQVEYLAYAMCDRGVQRLRRDEVLALFEEIRRDYPHIRALKRNEPEAFLKLLEARTSLVVEAGHVRHDGELVPVYEFRHLTFQEYLAAMALVRGRHPGFERGRSLAERVAPLAGRVEKRRGSLPDMQVTEAWREALRLCVTSCNDEDVDEVLEAILTPLEGEKKTERPRAVLAMLCLADEPNVSDEVAHEVLGRVAALVAPGDGGGIVHTALDQAALELVASDWCEALRSRLVDQCRRGQENYSFAGALAAMMGDARLTDGGRNAEPSLEPLVEALASTEPAVRIHAALTTSVFAYRCTRQVALQQGGVPVSPAAFEGTAQLLGDELAAVLRGPPDEREAAAWALGWLVNPDSKDIALLWSPSEEAWGAIRVALSAEDSRGETVEFLGWVVAKHATAQRLPWLAPLLKHPDQEVRRAAVGGIAAARDDEVDRNLLSQERNPSAPWLDPHDPITEGRVALASKTLDLPPPEIRRRYERLASEFGLRLEWKPDDG